MGLFNLNKQKKKTKRVLKKRLHPNLAKKSSTREIHMVSPIHLIKSEELESYKKTKGNLKKRPVMISKKVEGTENVEISQIYSPPKKSENKIKFMLRKKNNIQTEIRHTRKIKKGSRIDTKTIKTDEWNNRPFKKGIPPLDKKVYSKMDVRDYQKHKEAQRKRKK